MANYRKMLSVNAPYLQSLMQLIETQSKETLFHWCIAYAEEQILPIYEKQYPRDKRPRDALTAAQHWLDGKIKLPEAKKHILACHLAAREAENNPAAQAAARMVGSRRQPYILLDIPWGLPCMEHWPLPMTAWERKRNGIFTSSLLPKSAGKWKPPCAQLPLKTSRVQIVQGNLIG